MDRLTIADRVKIVKTYYKNDDSPAATFRALRGDFGRFNRPTQQAVCKIVKKFEKTGSVTDIAKPVHHRNARSAENIAAVSESVADDPISIPRRAQHLGLSYGSLWRILHLDLHLHPYGFNKTAPQATQHNPFRRYCKKNSRDV